VGGVESRSLGHENPGQEQRGVVAGLEKSGSPEAELLLQFMREQALGTGED
jgi:hypothetical protein